MSAREQGGEGKLDDVFLTLYYAADRAPQLDQFLACPIHCGRRGLQLTDPFATRTFVARVTACAADDRFRWERGIRRIGRNIGSVGD
jgi:hypothetical protein